MKRTANKAPQLQCAEIAIGGFLCFHAIFSDKVKFALQMMRTDFRMF